MMISKTPWKTGHAMPGRAIRFWSRAVRYFLHLRDDSTELLDEEGQEFPDVTALVAKVLINARGMMAHDVDGGRLNLGYRIDAENPGGDLIHRLLFRDAIEIVGLV